MVFDPNINKTANHSTGNLTNQIKISNTGESIETVQQHNERKLFLNAKITAVTSTIEDKFSELFQLLEESQETIPMHSNQGVTLLNLKTYHKTLTKLLNNFILASPDGSTVK
jgi:hypothetical protein